MPRGEDGMWLVALAACVGTTTKGDGSASDTGTPTGSTGPATPLDACLRFVDAMVDCGIDTCGGDTDCEAGMASSLPASTCDPYRDLEGDAATAALALFACYLDALADADCADPDQYQAALEALDTCADAATTP